MKKGKVFLVGAGPGDIKLLTIKAKECIESADIIIYDYLANEEILKFAENPEKIIYAGKKAKNHTYSQNEINKLLIKYAKEDYTVVRLKGGDPFIFGRGGEEAIELHKNNIDFEIIPGITSGIAVPAYAGIPLTHRMISSSTAFITGHEADDKKDSVINWRHLATACDTLVFFMGVKNSENITKNLMMNGLNENTPAAVIQNGTTLKQKVITGTLKNINIKMLENNIKPPALIVIGKVVNLQEKINWFMEKPLFGKTILTTRYSENNNNLKLHLNNQGADVIEFPVIKASAKEFQNSYNHVIKKLDSYDWVIFTSRNGVKFFFETLYKNGYDVRKFGNAKIAAIGPSTADSVQEYSIKVDLIPDSYVAEGLIKDITKRENLKNKKLLIARSSIGRKLLTSELKKEKALIDEIQIYSIKLPKVSNEKIHEIKNQITNRQIDCITFTSSSCVNNLIKILNIDLLIDNRSNYKIASIGPVTSKTLIDNNLYPDIEADKYTFDGLTKKIIEYYTKKL